MSRATKAAPKTRFSPYESMGSIEGPRFLEICGRCFARQKCYVSLLELKLSIDEQCFPWTQPVVQDHPAISGLRLGFNIRIRSSSTRRMWWVCISIALGV